MSCPNVGRPLDLKITWFLSALQTFCRTGFDIHPIGPHHGRTQYANKMFAALETVEVYHINVTATRRSKAQAHLRPFG
jgi:hypothetical protein